ncbi:ADP-ribosylglycohydrolase family protein [Mitsuokella multacida]|uniref:ADP-ribosylglycohydrolase family protein n=1 Tax=Mitsuokella multacida TaxID=52226 RepID=UPI0024332172|nr:ADP-ribosylglycohydrolase family protein [Mitsuokella multacida]
MMGAIIGDIVGSRFEWHNYRHKDFTLFHPKCRPTDDSIMTLAVAKAILAARPDYEDLPAKAVAAMQELGRAYPRAGYGRGFRAWLQSDHPEPYNSFGNGSAMRVSPTGFAARTEEEAQKLALAVTAVTHNHPEGIKGAEAVAVLIYHARQGMAMEDLHELAQNRYYPLDFTLDEIRPTYEFSSACQGSVPQALVAFFSSTGFEDAIRNAISIGGDSDTIAAIAGSIAEAHYGIPADLREAAMQRLDAPLQQIVTEFESVYPS